ncbi:MAG: hypothetical protein GY856_17430, partial [bacterium]|nr:hypothetical protein [bacterium]
WGAFNLEGLSTPIDIVYYHLDADGDVVDGPVQLSTPEAEEDVAAAWNGSEYGVVTVRRSDTTSEVWFQRLEVDGTLVGTPAAIWENAFGQAIYGVSVVWNGSGWAVAFADTRDDGSEAIFLRLLDAAGTPLGPAVRISDEFDPAYPPEDEIPVYDETPQLVLKPGGGYEIFTSSYVWGTFVYEIGRLAADAGGNKVGARTILSDGDGIHSVINHVTTDGTNYLVGYNDGRLGTQEVAVVLADGSGAALAGPTDVTSGHSPGSSWYLTGAGTPQVVPLGAGFVALWADPISGDNLLQAQIYDGSGAVAASRFPLSARDVASWPSAVAVGDTFAVAWKDESTNAVVFDRYDAAGTSLLGEVELTTGASHHGAGLAWSGEVFGVVWVDGNQLVFQRVAVDGALVDSPVVVPGTAVGPRPRIQWVGAGWALLWRNNADSNLYYALLGPEGELLVPAVQVTYTPSRPSYYRLLWTGETLGLTWSETRGATGQDIYFTVLGLAGFKAFPEVTAVSSIHGDSHPVLTWDTDRFRLVHLSGYGGLREIEILPDGTVLPDELLVSNHTGTLHAASNGATTGLLFSHRADMFFETLECVADTTPPTAPGLGGAFDGTSVALSWTPGTDAESGILTYYLYRDGMLLAELFGTTTSFDDGGFVADSSHSYELRALNGAYLESAPSTLIISTETDPGVPIFSDGFESGDMSMWSSKVP